MKDLSDGDMFFNSLAELDAKRRAEGWFNSPVVRQDWFTSPEVRKEWEDFVNPDHYRTSGIECIEYQRATSTPEEFQGYLKNCCVKYLHRMRTKDDPLKNLLKAQWYLNRLVEEFKKQP